MSTNDRDTPGDLRRERPPTGRDPFDRGDSRRPSASATTSRDRSARDGGLPRPRARPPAAPRGRGRCRQDGARQGPRGDPRGAAHPPPVLRGPRRLQRRLRVELPPPDARDPAARGARRHRRRARHLRSRVPHPPAAPPGARVGRRRAAGPPQSGEDRSGRIDDRLATRLPVRPAWRITRRVRAWHLVARLAVRPWGKRILDKGCEGRGRHRPMSAPSCRTPGSAVPTARRPADLIGLGWPADTGWSGRAQGDRKGRADGCLREAEVVRSRP